MKGLTIAVRGWSFKLRCVSLLDIPLDAETWELRNVDSIMPRISPSPPTPLPSLGEGSKSPVPLLPSWEKGLGDEGRPKHGISEVI
jgi:hypothetical protein